MNAESVLYLLYNALSLLIIFLSSFSLFYYIDHKIDSKKRFNDSLLNPFGEDAKDVDRSMFIKKKSEDRFIR